MFIPPDVHVLLLMLKKVSFKWITDYLYTYPTSNNHQVETNLPYSSSARQSMSDFQKDVKLATVLTWEKVFKKHKSQEHTISQ